MSANRSTPLVVGVGASAGGIEAFQDFLKALGDSPGFAIVFVQHLDPNGKSLLSRLLRNSTQLDVVDLTGRTRVRTDTIYICPPGGLVELRGGALLLVGDEHDGRQNTQIDHFFHSIGESADERGIGIILSGAGSDGTLGLKAISDFGGMTFAQDADSAKYDSMPRNAATTGVADHVLPPPDIARELMRYVEYLSTSAVPLKGNPLRESIEESIPDIAELLEKETDHHFQHYKASTLGRRIQRRMQVLKIVHVADYVDRLRSDADEVHQLFRELLIGVTAFFRDPESFDRLAKDVLPKLFENRSIDDPVRIWVPGCASGEEAYSIAMLCREYLDNEPTSSADGGPPASVADPRTFQIFASDIDERALAIARQGVYPIGIADHVSEERLTRFFVKKGNRFHVTKEIREAVLFSPHNLISDPPFSRQDLISCRNLLIYLGTHLQKKLIPLFHYSLRPGGYLFLGPSESITSHGDLFRSVSPKHRISQQKGTAIPRTAPLAVRSGIGYPLRTPGTPSPDEDKTDIVQIMQRIVLDEFSPKSVVIDEAGRVICTSGDAGKYLSTGEGVYQNNIIKLAKKGLRIGLRAAMTEAKAKRRRVTHENLSVQTAQGKQRVMLTVQPMMRLGEDSGLFLIVFHDIGLPLNVDDERSDNGEQWGPRGNHDRQADMMIDHLERELASTREDLEKTMQDMDAGNEELKSSNEELLSMNEELQSANEELETSKEEIRASSDAVARANADLENLLRSTQIATVFLDDELNIRSFTPAIAEIYSLIPTDIGRPLEKFVPDVKDMPPLPSPQSVREGDTVEHTILAHSGKSYIRRVLPYRSHTGQTEGIVVTFNDVTQLRESQDLFELLVDASAQIVWITNAEGYVEEDSPSWRTFTGQTYEQWKGHGWLEVIHPDDRDTTMSAWKQVLESGEILSLDYRLRHHSGEYRWTRVRAVAQRNPDGSVKRWVGMNTDIDDQKRAEQELHDSKEQLRIGVQVALLGLGRIDYATDTVTLSSEAAEIYGLGKDKITLRRDQLHAVFHRDDRERIAAQITRSLVPDGDGLCEMDHRVVLPDGQERWISIRNQVYFDRSVDPATPIYATLVARDITYRKLREIELADAKSRLELSLEVSGVAIWSWNMQTDAVISNPALNRIFGFEEDQELTVNDFIRQMDESVRERVRAAIDDAIKNGSTYDQEYPIVLKTGEIRHVRAVGKIERGDGFKPQQFFGVVMDVTDRKQRELDTAQREAHLRRVIDNQLGLVGVIDRHGNLVEVDERWLRIARSRREQLIGKPFADAPWWNYDPDVAAKLNDSMRKAYAGEVVRYDVSLFAHGDDGVLIDFMIAPVFDDDGKVEYLIPSGVDIRERKRIELAQQESERRALQASESKSEFLANMSHEIRTPMTAILGYAELLQGFVDQDEAKHYLQTIRCNGDYLLEIINDILDLSKIEAGRFEVDTERFEPRRVIEDVYSIMGVRAKESGLELDVEYEGRLPKMIQSDAKRLKQILINLVGNAVKFTRKGRVELRVRYDEGMLYFDVMDTGIGMSEEQQRRLFQPFSQGDASVSRLFGGTGLGLAISRRLTEMLGGRIVFSSTEGVGSTFTASIATGKIDADALVDYSIGMRPAIETESPTTEVSLESNCHVLVVDDRRDIRFLSKRILTQAGATVDECEDGQLAVEHMEDCLGKSTCPDLILLDMQMPNLDGYQTARKLRQLGFNGPIIALTADAMQGDMNECLSAGCTDYLSKPIDKTLMLKKVSEILKTL